MYIIDAHCDAIYKLLENPQADFHDDAVLDVTLPRLQKANMKLQYFAIYISENFSPQGIDSIWMAVDVYYRRILNDKKFMPIRSKADLPILMSGSQIGAMLTLEGVDRLSGNLMYLRILHKLGLRAVGVTWNYANWAADGVGEARGGGFTRLGKQLVKECEKLGILIDVSHLSERSFWELAEMAKVPFFASHSNVFEICRHRRNLNKSQIAELIRIGGCIGLTFVPQFVQAHPSVSINDLLKHIDFVGGIGGTDHVAFGSDFDGIEQWIPGLEHPGKYENLKNILLKHYKESDVEKWMFKNWYRYLYDNLI